jgi:hypothetical protein
MLALDFRVFKCIELNMAKEKVVTLRFNRETLKPSLTSSIQQSHGQASKIAPPKGKGPKQEPGGISLSYIIKQGGEDKC